MIITTTANNESTPERPGSNSSAKRGAVKSGDGNSAGRRGL